jgi:formate dehydrogenase maturation protein FdhE
VMATAMRLANVCLSLMKPLILHFHQWVEQELDDTATLSLDL